MSKLKKGSEYPDLEAHGYEGGALKTAISMIDAERALLKEQTAELEACDCRKGMFPNPSRRTMLFAAGSVAGAALAASGKRADAEAAKAPPGAVLRDVPPDPTKIPGAEITADGGYGSRSQFETEIRVITNLTPTKVSSWSFSPLDKSVGTLTPSGLHFERHHGGIPTIDPAKHTLA